MLVSLANPILIAGRETAVIELRPPGRKVFEVMRAARGPARFAEAPIVRFAARLSGRGESTIRRFADRDLEAIGRAVEELYCQARRRFAVRSALAESAKAAAMAILEADA